MERRNLALSSALRPVAIFAVGGCVWAYNTAGTIRQGSKADTDAKVLTAKLSLNWMGLYKVPAVGPCTPSDTRDASRLGVNVLCLDIPCHISGSFRHNVESPVPTSTTMATSPKIWQRG